MKVRFYRGPMDGKVKAVADHMHVIEFASYSGLNYVASGVGHYPTAPVASKNHRYYRTNHTHPDGSVFFEWDQPRGTKTGVPRKRKKKTPVASTWNPGYHNINFFSSSIATNSAIIIKGV